MNKDLILSEAAIIRQGLDTLSVVLKDLSKRLRRLEERIKDDADVNSGVVHPILKSIIELDRSGINISLAEIETSFNTMFSGKASEEIIVLLKNGDIFEVEGKVYPLDTKNLDKEGENVGKR